MPCHAASTSLVGAQARASTVGNRSSHSSQRVITRATCVCWQHDLRQQDGIRVARATPRKIPIQTGPFRSNQRAKGADVIHGCSFGTGQERARARYLACGQHSLQETYVQNALRSANLGSTAGGFRAVHDIVERHGIDGSCTRAPAFRPREDVSSSRPGGRTRRPPPCNRS